ARPADAGRRGVLCRRGRRGPAVVDDRPTDWTVGGNAYRGRDDWWSYPRCRAVRGDRSIPGKLSRHEGPAEKTSMCSGAAPSPSARCVPDGRWTVTIEERHAVDISRAESLKLLSTAPIGRIVYTARA